MAGNCKYVRFVGACRPVHTALSGVMPELLYRKAAVML